MELNVLKGALNDGACAIAKTMTAPAVYVHRDWDNNVVSSVPCTEVCRIPAGTVTLWRLTRGMF